MTETWPFLFGVDLEVPDMADKSQGTPLADLVQRYLDLLADHDGRATFFIVGNVARRYPGLVGRIAAAGHEIACHSDTHLPLATLGQAGFRDDLRRNREALGQAGAGDVVGYRAPCFSLTEATIWAYPILAEEGFSYSSSVLPARNPHYGWPGFGRAPRMIADVLELPITLLPWRLLPVPAAGGMYFRALPAPLLRRAHRRLRREGTPLLGYFHPYDLDTQQPFAAFPGFSKWSVGNALLFLNRRATMERLRTLARDGFRFESYRSQIAEAHRWTASATSSS